MRRGVYDAIIDEVVEDSYGDDDSPMIRIVFRIPYEDVYFCTHIYLPGNYSPGAKRRLWHFCQCVGLDVADLEWDPHMFQGRRLKLRIADNSPVTSSPYSDVDVFLPSQWTGEDATKAQESLSDCSWITPLVACIV